MTSGAPKFWAFTVQNTPKFSDLRGSSQMPITRGGEYGRVIWAQEEEYHKNTGEWNNCRKQFIVSSDTQVLHIRLFRGVMQVPGDLEKLNCKRSSTVSLSRRFRQRFLQMLGSILGTDDKIELICRQLIQLPLCRKYNRNSIQNISKLLE